MKKIPTRSPQENWYTRDMATLWHRSPMYHEALRRQKKGINQYECEKCRKIFLLREVQVDHIVPKVDPGVGWVNCQTFAARLNCPSEGLQVLCTDTCHAGKTGKENSKRQKVKKCASDVTLKTKDSESSN